MKTISMSQFGNLNICHYPELDTQARKGSPPFVANKHSFTSPPLQFLHYTKRDHSDLTPHTVVLRKTQKMHMENNKQSAAAFYMVFHIQKESKLYLSIQLRYGHFGIISNLAP